MSKADDLQNRAEAFADLSIQFIDGLPKGLIPQRMGGQLLDSSTPVASNYRAARRRRSHDEFTAKLEVVSEEADERTARSRRAPNRYSNCTSTIADVSSPQMIQVHRVIPDALAEILRKAPLNDEKVAFAWRSSVGPAIDRGTSVTLQCGVLRVTVREAAWGREIDRSETLIRARLEALLGRGVVRAIKISSQER